MAPVYPTASGHPDYSSTGSTAYIPAIWSTKMVTKFYAATVFGEIANTDHQDEIKAHGDTVQIRTVPDITVNDYNKGAKLTYENPESDKVTLLIDKGKYWAFGVDHVDRKQSDLPFVDKWSADASEQLKISIDTAILADIYADVSSSNAGATAGAKSSSYNLGASTTSIAITKANVLDYIVDCGSVLWEQDCPESDRWFVLPTWMANLIKKSDSLESPISERIWC